MIELYPDLRWVSSGLGQAKKWSDTKYLEPKYIRRPGTDVRSEKMVWIYVRPIFFLIFQLFVFDLRFCFEFFKVKSYDS